MSTEIKPGQVWAWNDGRPTVQVLHIQGSLAFYRILPAGDDHYAVPLSTLAIEAHLVTDATPAPLDPSKVKAGDTVTLTVDPPDSHPAFTVAGETHSIGGSSAYVGGWRVDDLPDYVTLTDHQPAPEPEPEWEDGTPGTANVNNLLDGASSIGMRVMRVEDGFAVSNGALISDGNLRMSVSDFVPDEPRPLPTREQIAVAIARADSHESQSNHYLKNADAVLALLRGESR